MHSVLIYNLRTVPFNRHAAVLSLLDLKKYEMDQDESSVPTIDMLTEALADIGNNWERVPLKHGDGRLGWQEAMIGCLKDVCTLLPDHFLRNVLIPRCSTQLCHPFQNCVKYSANFCLITGSLRGPSLHHTP